MSKEKRAADDPTREDKRTFKDYQFPPGVSGCLGGRGGKLSAGVPQELHIHEINEYEEKILSTFEQLVRGRNGGDQKPVVDHVVNGFVLAAAEATSSERGGGREGAKKDHKPALAALKEYEKAVHSRKRSYDDRITLVQRYRAIAEEEFERHRRSGKRPPAIVPHPDHVRVIDGQIVICGPWYRENQEAWEIMKAMIRRVAAEMVKLKRQLQAKPNDSELMAQLEQAQKSRRALMRKVPKGWNWKESIITCDSDGASLALNLCRIIRERPTKEIFNLMVEAWSE